MSLATHTFICMSDCMRARVHEIWIQDSSPRWSWRKCVPVNSWFVLVKFHIINLLALRVLFVHSTESVSTITSPMAFPGSASKHLTSRAAPSKTDRSANIVKKFPHPPPSCLQSYCTSLDRSSLMVEQYAGEHVFCVLQWRYMWCSVCYGLRRIVKQRRKPCWTDILHDGG